MGSCLSGQAMKQDVWITKVSAEGRETLRDEVPQEVALTLYHNGSLLVTLMCSPGNLKELALGFLFSAGVIDSVSEVKELLADEKSLSVLVETEGEAETGEKVYTSGCGKGIMLSDLSEEIFSRRIEAGPKISCAQVSKLQAEFQRKSAIFKETGGVHSAALADGNGIKVLAEDIGRHNAIDKVIGKALLGNLNLEDLIILTSGRISSEIVLKAARCGTGILVSRSAPTDRAVEMARQVNLTLIGFARGNRMNVYSAEGRVW